MASPQTLVPPIEDRRLLGIGLLLAGVGLFSCLDATAKYLVLAGYPPFQVAFVRHLVTLVIVLGVFVPREGRALFVTKNIKLEIARGLCMGLGTTLNFASLQYLSLSVTGSILFSMPLIVTALSVVFLGEKVGWRRWVAVFVGFVGVLIVVRPGGATFHPAVFLSLTTAVIFSVFNILNRKLAGVDSVHSQQFFAALICVTCLAPGAVTQWVWPQTMSSVWLFVAMGCFGTLGHFLATAAHRYAPASTLAPFFYPQLIFFSGMSWLIFDQPPDIYVVVGALVVVGAGLYIWMRERDAAVEKV